MSTTTHVGSVPARQPGASQLSTGPHDTGPSARPDGLEADVKALGPGRRRVCPKGHKLETWADLTTGGGCRTCHRDSQRRYRQNDSDRAYQHFAVLIDTDATWMRDAECRDEDPAPFFAADDASESGRPGNGRRRRREDEAKAVCAYCPVIAECRDYALRNDERYGVWGGLGEDERRTLRYQRGA